MNGLDFIDLKEASFADRLLKREPRENAFVEINNVLAVAPIRRIEKEEIDSYLEKYGVSIDKAIPRFIDIYSRVLSYFVRDFVLSEEDSQQLWHLQRILSLDDEQIGRINEMVIYPVFQNAVSRLILDGVLSELEQGQLDQLAVQLRIPPESIYRLYSSVVNPFFQSKLNASISDRLFSPEEEQELTGLAKNLKLSLVYDATLTQNLERFRYLWRLYSEGLPNVQIPLYLQKGEYCSAFVDATYHRLGGFSGAMKYSGITFSQDPSGIPRFCSGMVRTYRIPEKVLPLLDSGVLYFTNKRLLFNGAMHTSHISLQEIIGATFFVDGLLLERDTGTDEFFRFYTDFEALQIIFDNLMTKSRM